MAEKYREPQICVFNNEKIVKKLDEQYVVASCDLGVTRKIEYDKYGRDRHINIDFKLIPNLHEYRVLIIDLQEKNEIQDSTHDEEPYNKSLFEVSYPTKYFNPTPFLLSEIRSDLNKDCLKIIFASETYIEKYHIAEVQGKGELSYPQEYSAGVYSIIQTNAENKTGKRIYVENIPLASIISKYAKSYQAVFTMPTRYNVDKGEREPNPDYIPLLKNQDGEVISYIGYDENYGYELVLPICENKAKLISVVFSQFMPEILPNLFPESKSFEWINSDEYLPTEYSQHLKEQQRVKKEYEEKLAALKDTGNAILQKYQFLRNLLIETGDKLVKAVCEYLKWLGFDNVTEMDGKDDIFREDIQVIEGNKLFMIEVKGLGGTSTDSECAQVAKHRRRREKENRDKDIFPIYIVNHQRYINPSQRQNPPFSKDQIDYAENDERGLLTTLQLFNQFKLIEQGIFSKEDTRACLSKIGLISLVPDSLVSIGVFNEYFKKNNAGILNLCNCKITLGTELYAKKDEGWVKTPITSIQLNDVSVDFASNGEVGIVTELELAKGYEIFIRKS